MLESGAAIFAPEVSRNFKENAGYFYFKTNLLY